MNGQIPPLPLWLVVKVAQAIVAGEVGPLAVMYETADGPVWELVDRGLLPSPGDDRDGCHDPAAPTAVPGA